MRFGGRGPENVNWTGDNPSKSCGRQRARKLFPGTHVCEIAGCGKKAERHHKDDNPGNNDPSNIAFLCHRHHVLADGRMTRAALRAAHLAAIAGKPLTQEHRAKIGAAHQGMKRSEAARAAMSAAKKALDAARPKPTHCPKGHPYDLNNTYIKRNGVYECRTCGRERSLRWYYAQRGAA